jgi:hypothetical protein
MTAEREKLAHIHEDGKTIILHGGRGMAIGGWLNPNMPDGQTEHLREEINAAAESWYQSRSKPLVEALEAKEAENAALKERAEKAEWERDEHKERLEMAGIRLIQLRGVIEKERDEAVRAERLRIENAIKAEAENKRHGFHRGFYRAAAEVFIVSIRSGEEKANG